MRAIILTLLMSSIWATQAHAGLARVVPAEQEPPIQTQRIEPVTQQGAQQFAQQGDNAAPDSILGKMIKENETAEKAAKDKALKEKEGTPANVKTSTVPPAPNMCTAILKNSLKYLERTSLGSEELDHVRTANWSENTQAQRDEWQDVVDAMSGARQDLLDALAQYDVKIEELNKYGSLASLDKALIRDKQESLQRVMDQFEHQYQLAELGRDIAECHLWISKP